MSDDLNFHYRREDRLARRSAPRPRKEPPKLLGGRRSPILLLVNLGILVVLIALYGRTLASADARANLAGCRLVLHAGVASDALEAVLEVEVTDAAASGQRLYAVFAAGEADVRLSEVLPQAGGRVVLRGRLPYAAAAAEVRAEVSIGGKTTKLRRALERAADRR